jgi:signal transduction histidine kinase
MMSLVSSGPVSETTSAVAPGGEAAACVFRLPPATVPGPTSEPADDGPERTEILCQHAAWFCCLRWAVVAVLVALGCAVLFPAAAGLWPGLRPGWILGVAGVLAASNVAYLVWLAPPARRTRQIRALLWAQIATDLFLLTVVVHHLGSTQSYAAVLYLFHIIIACICLSVIDGLLVTALAACLFLACVIAESAGLWPARALPAPAMGSGEPYPATAFLVVQTLSLILIWLVTWFLVARLAGALSRRERELASSNRRLEASGVERMHHMVQTTHQLKAPFAAIHAQAQLLREEGCGALPPEALRIVDRMAERCRVLSQQIQDMLQLANLRSESQAPAPRQELDLAALVETSVARIVPAAALRGIAIEADVAPLRILGNEDHLRMLLDNLLANAVNYSHDKSRVWVRAGAEPDGSTSLVVVDEGIGIPPDKLPRIFDDYFRAKEAVQHNPSSTGLGLAIVRDVAWADEISVEVTSAPGKGTRFELTFPRAARAADEVLEGANDGVPHDR